MKTKLHFFLCRRELQSSLIHSSQTIFIHFSISCSLVNLCYINTLMQENPFSDNILTFKICANWCLLSPIPNLVINGCNPCYHEAEKGTLMLQVYWCKSHEVLVDLAWQSTQLIIFLLDIFLMKKSAIGFFFIVCLAFMHCFPIIHKYMLYFSVSKNKYFLCEGLSRSGGYCRIWMVTNIINSLVKQYYLMLKSLYWNSDWLLWTHLVYFAAMLQVQFILQIWIKMSSSVIFFTAA